MNYQLVSSYKDTPKLPREVGALTNTPHFSFIDGPKVEITGQADESYEVNFIDRTTGATVYTSNIKNNMWCASSLKYYVDWKLEVKRHGVVVAEEILNLKDKKVKVVFDTNSLGDIFAYVGAVDAFQVKHGCKMHCVIYPREVREIFSKSYENITFESNNDDNAKYYAVYTIGWFNDWEGRSHQNPRQISLANLAGSILGLGELEFKPKLPKKSFRETESPGKKYVCIAVQSTAQFKYWNNPTGWDDVVKYLKKLGYDVWCIDRHNSFGIPGHMNKIPKGVIDKTGDFSLTKRLEQIAGAEFFIGLSSGLSWMAWALNKPVILISGMGQPWTEFFTPHRVINTGVCHGCTTEDSFVFEKDNWLLCPHKKNFECTRKISSQMVIDEIVRVCSGEFAGMVFDWGWYSSTKKQWSIFRELFRERTYERFFKVEEGDVVMDIGAHIGAFSYSIGKSKPSRIIAVEPSTNRLPALSKNLGWLPAAIINKGIGDKAEKIKDGLVFDGIVEDLELTTFADIIEQQDIDKIDFLKIDCEGGEYSIFTEQNIDWIIENVRKIAGEWHLETLETKQKFRAFCDTYLPKFSKVKILSIDGMDITSQLVNRDQFLSYYNEVMIYIDNRKTHAPTTVSITEVGLRTLVTGASGGLGTALEAECLARNLTYIGHGCHSPREGHVTCDFSDLDAVQKMEDVIKKNNINCLINNAGIYTNENFPELTDERIIEILHVNLVAPTLLAKYLYKHLTSTNQPGYIVNIISLAGKYPNYNEAVYCASKYGLSGLGSSLSINQKNSKIRVIDLHLGAIKTRLTKHRPNYNDLIEPAEVAKLVLDMIQNKGQYVASSMEIRNIK